MKCCSSRGLAAIWALSAALSLSACASGPNKVESDPLEPMNRQVSRFNDAMDNAVAKPLANIYVAVTPDVARKGIDNFFANLGDVWSAANAVLQAKPKAAGQNLLRFGVNTFLGFGGLIDWASDMGIERSRKDFGQTLGRWGVDSGPYLVIPFLGPSSVRDGSGLVLDSYADLLRQFPDPGTRDALWGTRLIRTRASLFAAEALRDGAALDNYSFTRDAYLQYRQNRVEAAQEPEEYGSAAPTPAESPKTP
jgi:phospholipid-binding lipoprotein MlaA